MCRSKFGRLDAFFVRGFKPAVADIIHNGAGEQMRILKHDGKRAAQIVFFDAFNINSVISYRAALNIVKAVYKVCDGCFPCTR